MDAVKQRDGLICLVRLQLADEVERYVRMHLTQRGPFFRRLLHPVFAKHALACLDQRGDVCGGVGLADGDQSDVAGLAPGEAGGGGDAGLDLGEAPILRITDFWLIDGAVL